MNYFNILYIVCSLYILLREEYAIRTIVIIIYNMDNLKSISCSIYKDISHQSLLLEQRSHNRSQNELI